MTNSLKRSAELPAEPRPFPTPAPELGGMRSPGPFGRILALLKAMRANARQRRELAELSEYALRDIGVSRAQVVAELAKPAWR